MGAVRGARRRRWFQVAAVGAITAAATVAGSIDGGAVDTYTVVVTPDEVLPMEIFTVTNADGAECAPGSEVLGSLDLPVSGWSTTADGNGDWSKQLYIYENIGYDVYGNPIPTPPGEYHVFVHCDQVNPTEVGAAAGVNYEEAVITLLPTATDPGWSLDFDEPAARAAAAAAGRRIAALVSG